MLSSRFANQLAAGYGVGLAFLVGLAVLSATHTAVPENAADDIDRQANWVNFVLPQGWSFFTRDPREERTYVYVRTDGVWRNALRTPHSRASNSFGMNRLSRAQGTEAGFLVSTIAADAWRDCRTSDVECIALAAPPQRVKNPGPNATVCGDIGLVRRAPVPWAWSHSANVVMPARTARLEVTC